MLTSVSLSSGRDLGQTRRPLAMPPPEASRAKVSAYALHAAVTCAVAALVDFLVGADERTASASFAAFGLGAAGGLALGGAWILALVALRPRSGRAQRLGWALLGALLTLWLILRLGVLARIGGADRLEAIAAIFASLGAGGLLAALGLATQPAGDAPGWLDRVPRARLRGPLVGLVLTAAGLIAADRVVGLGSYAAAHNALRVMALVVLVVATRTAARLVHLPPVPRAPRLGLAALAAAALAWALARVGPDHDVLADLLARPFSGTPLRFLRVLSDVDRDGYAAILGGGDCAPIDPTVHPFAADVPGNGVDENCRLGDAPPPPPVDRDPPIPSEPSPVSVVLITIDTVRADHTSWGGPRDTTPRIARWAKTGTLFKRAYTSGSWTSLALSSLLHGVFPRRLTWVAHVETNRFRLLRRAAEHDLRPGERLKLMFGLPNHDPHQPLQSYLHRRGMHTMAVIDDGATGFLDVSSGAYPDFDEYIEVSGKAVDKAVSDAAIKLLKAQPKDRRFFLWTHYFGPHVPSRTHKGVPEFGDSVADKYDHEIVYTDRQVHRLLKQIEAMRKEHPIAVIITADHGEQLGRKRNHGISVREDDLRIPMVVRGPGIRRGESNALVSTVDIMPTILAWTQTPAPEGLDGVDLARLTAEPDLAADRILFGETWRFTADGEATHNMVAAFDGSLKLVWDLLDEDLTVRTQPKEQHRSYNTRGVARLQAALDAYLEVTGPPRFVD